MGKTTDILQRLRSIGLTQSEIGRRTGVSQSRLSRWERGAVPAGADDALKLLDLANQLGVAELPVIQTEVVNGEGAHA